LQNLKGSLTGEGDLLISNSTSRSQLKNKELALEQLVYKIKKALYVPKKRKAVRIPKAIKEARLQAKAKRSLVKKLRNKHYEAD
jgi:ribosome-associated protein